MELKQMLYSEALAINKFLAVNGIKAGVDQRESTFTDPTAGFVRYGLKLNPAQKFDKIEGLQRELSAVLSDGRKRMRLPSPVAAIPVAKPSFGIEVPHPDPKMLLWSPRKVTTQPAHGMLLGRSYAGRESKNETMSFADDSTCHVLVVGITGAGKSVLMQNMVLSLTANTSPQDLKIVMVDLKNKDMIPFKALPHVMAWAGNKGEAVEAIRYVYNEKEKRIKHEGYAPYRLILWIDEMAQLAAMREVAEMLGDLASIGRGQSINLVGATQYPTEKGGLGGLLKANFPLRLVGMVAAGQSHIATGLPKLHADLLPGNGAFLRLQGPVAQRFQSYMIDSNDVFAMANYIASQWQKGIDSPVIEQPIKVQPSARRDEIDEIADRVRGLWSTGASKNAMAKAAGFKQYAGSYATKIDEAIKRLASTTSPSTEASTTLLLSSTHTSEKGIEASSSRSDEKIIRFPKRAANG